MKLFFVEFPDDTDFSGVVRAKTSLEAAASLMSAAREEEIYVGACEVEDVTRLTVQEVPSRTGKPQNFGSLEKETFPVSDIPADENFAIGPDVVSPSGLPTDIFLVRIDDDNGDELFYVVEASSAEEARDIALDEGEVENGIDTIVVGRLPTEEGEAGILSIDEVIREERRKDPNAEWSGWENCWT